LTEDYCDDRSKDQEQAASGMGRRSLLRGSTLLPVAAAVAASTGMRPAVADEPAPAAAGAPAPKVEPKTAMEALAYALAVQAATYGAPIVAMYNLRATVAVGPAAKAPPGSLWRVENITTPAIAAQTGYVTPNVNVVYGFGFVDLGHQPYILTAPDSGGRYYMIEICDMWTHAFAYPAGKIAGYKGGKFALVGPGWNGTLPTGVTRIDAPTRWLELQPRVHVVGEADLAGAQEVLHAIKLQGLAEYNGGAAPAAPAYNYEVPKVNPKVASSQLQFDDPMQFWSIFSSAMNENSPPQNEIEAVLPTFKYLGIELGKPWNSQAVNPVFLDAMKKAAQEIGPILNDSIPLLGKVANGWLIPPPNTGNAGKDYVTNGTVAVYGLTANVPTEAIYYACGTDGKGQLLVGATSYTMTFTEPMLFAKPVAPGFWSITMYDGVTRYSVPNPINRYSLGSDNNFVKNTDGSFTIYIQNENPGSAKEANWLPSPKGPFYFVLRNYAPVPETSEGLKDPATFIGPPAVLAVS
jgi:hypothetical protein